MSKAVKPKERADKRPPVSFPPVQNGVDYLVSVIANLTHRPGRSKKVAPGPTELKYAVLHLQAATEVLLKARLVHEHWSLVVEDRNKATRGAFEAGEFHSCTLKETMARLKDVVGIDVGEAAKQAYLELGDTRNRLQHFGLTDTAAAIEARAAVVLDFLLEFIDQHLEPVVNALDAEDAIDVRYQLLDIREGMTEIRELVSVRMTRLRDGVLKDVKARTVKCPSCEQWALVIDGTAPFRPRCLLCTREWSELDDDLPGRYAVVVLGITRGWGDQHPALDCPNCDVDMLIAGVLLADAPDKPRRLCFHCGFTDDVIDS